MIDRIQDRRKEQRLRYNWPVWFAEDFANDLCQGQMVDVSSNGAAFTCPAEGVSPAEGQPLTARFSIPRFGLGESFEMANFTRQGTVCRVEQFNTYLRRIAVQFASPLPFKPGEQENNPVEESRGILAGVI